MVYTTWKISCGELHSLQPVIALGSCQRVTLIPRKEHEYTHHQNVQYLGIANIPRFLFKQTTYVVFLKSFLRTSSSHRIGEGYYQRLFSYRLLSLAPPNTVCFLKSRNIGVLIVSLLFLLLKICTFVER